LFCFKAAQKSGFELHFHQFGHNALAIWQKIAKNGGSGCARRRCRRFDKWRVMRAGGVDVHFRKGVQSAPGAKWMACGHTLYSSFTARA